MFHMFDTEIATRYGVNAAVLFQNIAFWCNHSRANGTNFHDGLYWTYNSVKAFQELFPYLGKSQISSALQKLLDEGLIVKGNYNKVAYDRTAWYAVTELGETMFRKPINANVENQQFDLSKIGNGNAENREPIPYINSDGKSDNKHTPRKSAKSVFTEGFDDFWAEYPRPVAKQKAREAWAKVKPDEGVRESILADIRSRKAGEWKDIEARYIPHPSTYLNQRRWEDEPPKPEPEKPRHLYSENLSPEELMRRQKEQAEKDREEARRQGLL